MKKLMVPIKEEECIVKELNTKEIEEIEAGGWFTCFFLKRCALLEKLWEINNPNPPLYS